MSAAEWYAADHTGRNNVLAKQKAMQVRWQRDAEVLPPAGGYVRLVAMREPQPAIHRFTDGSWRTNGVLAAECKLSPSPGRRYGNLIAIESLSWKIVTP